MPKNATVTEMSRAEFDKLVRSANRGNEHALRRLREVVDATPDLWARIGDLAAQTEQATLALLADGNLLVGESVRLRLTQMRAELGTEPESKIERFVVERVLALWLQLQLIDRQLLQAAPATPVGKYWVGRQAQTDSLYRTALRDLVIVQKSLRPSRATATPTDGLRVAPHTCPAATG